MKDTHIHIIGAGISGLIAAITLEKHGFAPTIIESSDRVGGRIKTDIIDGYQLDHGFQVLLSKYPAANKYLDYESLNLQDLNSGAVIFKNGNKTTIGDPLRDISVLFSTLFSNIGSFSDKLKILRLNTKLRNKELHQIFEEEEIATIDYLKNFGFSERIIESFFRPFFSGIYLEEELQTSSRMFEFVFKMFGEGRATLPKSGIEAISKQLRGQLEKTSFLFNTHVAEVKEHEIILNNGNTLKSNYTIIATEASHLTGNFRNKNVEWKSCDCIYFKSDVRLIDKPVIGLIANKDCLINNIFYHTSIEMDHQQDQELLSVTVVKEHNLSEDALIEKVTFELEEQCKITDLTFLKMYTIPRALPDLQAVKYTISPSETQIRDSIFLAGDVQVNGSLNGAMLAGEAAALGLIQQMEKKEPIIK